MIRRSPALTESVLALGRFASGCLGAGALAALAACASGARQPDLTLPAAYEAPPGSAAVSTGALDRWWLIFGDDELNRLEDQALSASPDVKSQEARLREAIATKKSGIFQTYPTGGLTGSFGPRNTQPIGAVANQLVPPGGYSESDYLEFKPSWELDFLGGLATERKAVRADFAATRFDIENARAALVAGVADEYFVARGLEIQIANATETQQIEQELLETATLKADHGLGVRSDADRIAGDLAGAQSQLSDYESQEHTARRLLLILVGRGPDPVESLPLTADVPAAPPIPKAVPGELLVRRPDLREADERMRAAALRTKLAKEQLFPNLTIEPLLGIARAVAPGIGVASLVPLILVPQEQTTSTSYWSGGIGFSQPVLDIPRLLEDAKAQGARTEEAVVAYEQSVQNAYGDAENSLVTLASDEDRIKVLTEGEARARRAFEDGRTRYHLGIDDITSVLAAQQTWRADLALLTSARVQAVRQAVATYKALGGGWEPQSIKTAAR